MFPPFVITAPILYLKADFWAKRHAIEIDIFTTTYERALNGCLNRIIVIIEVTMTIITHMRVITELTHIHD